MKLVIADIKSENLVTNDENNENSSATRTSYGINRSQTVVSEHNKFLYHRMMLMFYPVIVNKIMQAYTIIIMRERIVYKSLIE